MQKTRVLIIDDHPAMAFGTKLIVEQLSFTEVIGVCETGAAGVAAVQAECPDVILLDLILPDIHGVEIARQIKAIQQNVRIIIYSGEDNVEHYIDDLLEIGISGLLNKRVSVKQVQRTIECVLEGEAVLPLHLLHQLRYKEKIATDETHHFKEKEIEVLQLLANGHTNAEIAHAMFVSVKTVENYLTHIYRKLEVTSRYEAIQKWHEMNLV